MRKPIEEFIEEFTGMSPYVFKNMNKESEIEKGYYFEDIEDIGYNSDEWYQDVFEQEDVDISEQSYSATKVAINDYDIMKGVTNKKLIESREYLNKLLYHEYKSYSVYELDVTRKQPEDLYIYLATLRPSGNIVYIGCGRGGRYRHVNSGRSSSVVLNQLYFLTEGCIDVLFIDDIFLNRDALLAEESRLIELIKPYANIRK